MKTNDFNFISTNDKKSYTEHKKTLSSFNLQDLQNFPFFPKIKDIKTKFNNNQKKEESQLIRFDSDNLGKNHFYFTNLLNNQITIINNIFQNEEINVRKNKKGKTFSPLLDLNIHNVGKNKLNLEMKNTKRNSHILDNKEQINKITNVFFSKIPEDKKTNNNLDYEEEKLNNFNRLVTEENTLKSLNLIEKENDTIIKNKLKQISLKKSEQIHHFKKFGIFKGFIAFSSKNGKNINEDKIRISINTPINSSKETINFFAIFDGHNGDKSAKFLKENFHINLIKHEEILKDPKKAILDTFNFVEKKLLESNSENLNKSGSCALILFNKKNELYIANLGNSRAIISIENSKEINQISKEHSLNIQREKERIKKLGGKVFPKNNGTKFFVIPGNLEVSRSLGDIESKLKNFSGIPFMISHLPDLYKINNIEKIDFIILTSSGPLENLNNADFANIIYSTLKNGVENDISFDKTIYNINQNLMNCVIDRGCKNNISFIFIYTDKFLKLFKEKKILMINDILTRLKFSLDCMSDDYNNENNIIKNNSNDNLCSFVDKIFDGCYADKSKDENYLNNNSSQSKNNNNISRDKEKKKKKSSAYFWFNLICGCN